MSGVRTDITFDELVTYRGQQGMAFRTRPPGAVDEPIGGGTLDLPAASAINTVLDAAQGTPAVHLCFGNYGGQSVQKGTWDKLMRYLNSLHADHIVMEMAHREPKELEAFKDLLPEIGLGLGVIDIKRTEIEGADDIARKIERAEQVLGAGGVSYIHPDCGFWMLELSIADAKIAALVKGRDFYEGR